MPLHLLQAQVSAGLSDDDDGMVFVLGRIINQLKEVRKE